MRQNQILQFCNTKKILGEEIINTLQNGSRRIPPWIIAPPDNFHLGQLSPQTMPTWDNFPLDNSPR